MKKVKLSYTSILRKRGTKSFYSGILVLGLSLISSFPVCAEKLSTESLSTVDMLQAKKITGKVKDDNNTPLPGVTVQVKGTTTGTVTDTDGSFSITVPDNSAVLTFSFIGFSDQDIVVGRQSVIEVVLIEEIQNVDEVVVVAYGTQKKSHLTGSVASLKAEKLDEIPVSRLDQAMQGKLAGVQINNISPYAGEAPQIRVRGLGSISTNIDPLVIVDGFPVPGGLSMVSIGDVESVEVLKDASSSALYGSRAANGVILITTKSGNIKKPKYNFKSFNGIRTALKLPGKLNTAEYTELLYKEAEQRRMDPSVDGTSATMPFDLTNEGDRLSYLLAKYFIDKETDWVDEALRDHGTMQSYQLSASGGNNSLKYFISGNYNGEEGIMERSAYDKFSFRAKVDLKLSKLVSVGFNFNPTFSKKETPSEDLTDYLRFPGWVPVRHSEATAALTGRTVGEFAHPYHFGRIDFSGVGLNNEIWHITSGSASGSSSHNPVSVRERDKIFTDDYRLQSNVYLTIDLLPGLQFKTSDGVYAAFREFNEKAETEAVKAGDPNSLTRELTFQTDFLSENTLNYIKKTDDHDFGVLLGYTIQRTQDKSNTMVATGFPDEKIFSFNMASTLLLDSPELAGTTSYYYTESMMSVLGRVNYAFKGRYLISASFRTDGSSKFAEGHKWGNFPAASIGWRASDEKFLKDVKWLSNLKIRVSYGLTGNNNIPQYSYMNYLNTSNYVTGPGNGTLVPGLASNNAALGNPDITWEQTSEANYAVDLGLFNSRVNLTAEYYNSTTIQLLLQQPAMYITGHQTFWNNIGKVNNRGIEIELNTTNVDGKHFTWKTSANFSANRNKLLGYGNKSKEDNFGERNEVYRAMVGQPSIQYFGYKNDGIYTTFEEVATAKNLKDASGIPFNFGEFTPIIGGLKVMNMNGDNMINGDDRVVIGDPFPDFTWGITNTFTYKRFDVSFLFQGVQGVEIINGNLNYNETLRSNTVFLNDRYVSPMFPGDGKTVYGTNTAGKYLLLTEYGVEDGSYAALRDFSIGYTLSKKLTKAMKISDLRFYLSAQNLLYFMASNYRGVNPEARRTSGNYNNPLIDGYQRGVYPVNRTFTAGIDLSF